MKKKLVCLTIFCLFSCGRKVEDQEKNSVPPKAKGRLSLDSMQEDRGKILFTALNPNEKPRRMSLHSYGIENDQQKLMLPTESSDAALFLASGGLKAYLFNRSSESLNFRKIEADMKVSSQQRINDLLSGDPICGVSLNSFLFFICEYSKKQVSILNTTTNKIIYSLSEKDIKGSAVDPEFSFRPNSAVLKKVQDKSYVIVGSDGGDFVNGKSVKTSGNKVFVFELSEEFTSFSLKKYAANGSLFGELSKGTFPNVFSSSQAEDIFVVSLCSSFIEFTCIQTIEKFNLTSGNFQSIMDIKSDEMSMNGQMTIDETRQIFYANVLFKNKPVIVKIDLQSKKIEVVETLLDGVGSWALYFDNFRSWLVIGKRLTNDKGQLLLIDKNNKRETIDTDKVPYSVVLTF